MASVPRWHTWLKHTAARLSPTLYSRYLFRRMTKRHLHLLHPKGMDEKLMWLKLHTYRDNPLITQCADKYRVREYIRDCGCEHILNELYHVWDSPAEIRWDELPDSFVIKCNHGCGYNLLCPDKAVLDKKAALKKIWKWYRSDYWLVHAELQYRDIPKKVICEKYLDGDLPDYKIYCFNGVPRYTLACVGRYVPSGEHSVQRKKPMFLFFDTDWNLCPLNRDSENCPPEALVPKPEGYEVMLAIAQKLSQPFPYVRVDLYNHKGKIYFGELTFIPAAALDKARRPATDRMFGDLIDLHYTGPSQTAP